MIEVEMIKLLTRTTRRWRDRVLKGIMDAGPMDLGYRPSTGMSSLGWLIAHQAVAYDFSLNQLICSQPPIRPDFFEAHTPGTAGDWSGAALEDMNQYYDECEKAFLTWAETAQPSDFKRIVDGEKVPRFFQGMTVLEVISNLFVHLNYHNGHLSSIKNDILKGHATPI